MSFSNIDSTEKKVVTIAIFVSIGHLLLIAYAAMFLHISVPTCQPNEKLFTEPSLSKVGPLRYEVHYVAKMWKFEPKRLVIPKGATVDFFLGSNDVNHGFHINGTHVNLMAVPGVVNRATQTFRNSGEYPVICHEYCGFGHQNMNAMISVSDSVLEASIGDASSGEVGESHLSPGAQAGKTLFGVKGCTACHNTDGAAGGVGPTFKGLYGRSEEMQDGSKVTVDDAYIGESIKEPLKKVVKGYNPIMPVLPVSDDEIKNIIEYIITIK